MKPQKYNTKPECEAGDSSSPMPCYTLFGVECCKECALNVSRYSSTYLTLQQQGLSPDQLNIPFVPSLQYHSHKLIACRRCSLIEHLSGANDAFELDGNELNQLLTENASRSLRGYLLGKLESPPCLTPLWLNEIRIAQSSVLFSCRSRCVNLICIT